MSAFQRPRLSSDFVCSVRFSLKDLEKEYKKAEEHNKAVQSVRQIIGEVMKQLDDEGCTCFPRLISLQEPF
jgi:hypothetical protein